MKYNYLTSTFAVSTGNNHLSTMHRQNRPFDLWHIQLISGFSILLDSVLNNLSAKSGLIHLSAQVLFQPRLTKENHNKGKQKHQFCSGLEAPLNLFCRQSKKS